MWHHGNGFEHIWTVAFWVILILAGIASAAHAVIG